MRREWERTLQIDVFCASAFRDAATFERAVLPFVTGRAARYSTFAIKVSGAHSRADNSKRDCSSAVHSFRTASHRCSSRSPGRGNLHQSYIEDSRSHYTGTLLPITKIYSYITYLFFFHFHISQDYNRSRQRLPATSFQTSELYRRHAWLKEKCTPSRSVCRKDEVLLQVYFRLLCYVTCWRSLLLRLSATDVTVWNMEYCFWNQEWRCSAGAIWCVS